jgi:predicted histone-like DNA-binding protein
MAVKYRLHKANSKNASINGKWYARVSYGPQDVVTIDDLARDITQETVLTDVEVNGVIMALIRHMTNALREGKRVKLGDLGDFQPRLRTVGAVTTDDFSAANIKDVVVSWAPGKDFKSLRSEATFQLVPARKAVSDAIEVVKNSETIHGLE